MEWRWLAGHTEWKELWGRHKYVLMVVLAGVVLLLLPGGQEERKHDSPVQQQQEFNLESMEEKLERTLSRIRDAGEVTVVLTLKESTRQVFARDTRQSDRETSSTAVVLARGSGEEEPVLLQRIYPTYQGALVVCPGAGDARVKLQITQALRVLTGLSAEKITVCEGK